MDETESAHREDTAGVRLLPLPRSMALLTSLAAACGVLLFDMIFPEPRLAFEDLALELRSPRPLDDRIVLADLERWPVPRGEVARGLRAIGEGRPRVLGVDILLDEERDAPSDRDLSRTLASLGSVVLPTELERTGATVRSRPLMSSMARAARATGFSNFVLDPDGVVRRSWLSRRLPAADGRYGLSVTHSSFASSIHRAWLTRGGERPPSPVPAERPHRIDWGPVTRDRLKVASVPRLLASTSYGEALRQVRFLEDKIVLVGYLGSRDVGDLFSTPFTPGALPDTPGVIVHANLVSNLLSGDELRTLPRGWGLGLIFIGALVSGLLGHGGFSIAGSLGAAGIAGSPLLLEVLLVDGKGWVLQAGAAAPGAVLAYTLVALLSGQAALRVPMVRRLVTLLGRRARSDLAVLNVVSDREPGGGTVRITYQTRQGEGPDAWVAAFKTTAFAGGFDRLARQVAILDGSAPGANIAGEVEEMGKDLVAELMSPRLVRHLSSLQARHIHLELAGAVLAIPWEIAWLDGETVIDRFGVSRSVIGTESRKAPAQAPVREEGLTALIVANPAPLPRDWSPLPAAEEEARTVARGLCELSGSVPGGLNVEILCGRQASRAAVETRLASGEVDILHYSGHCTSGGGDASAAGFVLPGGVLGAGRLGALLDGVSAPPVVFANACSSGRHLEGARGSPSASSGEADSTCSLPVVFVEAGVQLYVGCMWRVETDAAARLALAFYEHLLKGVSAGEALKRARPEAADRWMTHAAYVMYGDPRLNILKPPAPGSPESAREGESA